MAKGTGPREALKRIVAQDKPGYVRAMFDSIAEDYDRMNWIMTGGLLGLWHRAFAKATRLAPGESALDVCSGTGDLAFIMAERVGPSGRVVGLDFSEKMLAIAQERAARWDRPRAAIEWVLGDALQLPYPDGGDGEGFHCVSMGFALRNVADIEKALREMARVARTGGRVVCLEVSRPENPVLRAGFNAYFYRVVPVLGRIAEKRLPRSGDLANLRPYTYLPYSLEHLPPPGAILEMMRSAGLAECARRPLTGGVVTLYAGVKRG